MTALEPPASSVNFSFRLGVLWSGTELPFPTAGLYAAAR
jgi:hypothetical protein